MRPWILSWLFPAKKKPTYSQVLQGLLEIRARCPNPGSPHTPLLLKEIVVLAVALAFLVKNQTFPHQNASTTYPPQELQRVRSQKKILQKRKLPLSQHKPLRDYQKILTEINEEFKTIFFHLLPPQVYVEKNTGPLIKNSDFKNILLATAAEKFQEFFPSRRLQQDIQSFLTSSSPPAQHTSAG